jgi:hypothetical protein
LDTEPKKNYDIAEGFKYQPKTEKPWILALGKTTLRTKFGIKIPGNDLNSISFK